MDPVVNKFLDDISAHLPSDQLATLTAIFTGTVPANRILEELERLNHSMQHEPCMPQYHANAVSDSTVLCMPSQTATDAETAREVSLLIKWGSLPVPLSRSSWIGRH